MYAIEDKLLAYTSFFADINRSFNEIDEVFGPLIDKTEYLMETYGNLDEDGDAGETANTQLSQLRILMRGYTDFMKKFSVSLVALRDDLYREIDFGQIILEGMGVEG